MKIFPGIIVRRHHTDQKQMGLLKEQCAEYRKAPLLYCCNQLWMKIDGQIIWIAMPICETFKISYPMGRRPMEDVLGNHLKDLLFHLVHWLSITLSLRRTSQESINLERKSYLDCSSDTLCTRVNLEGWRTDCRPCGVGDDGRIGNLLKKDSMRKEVIFPKENGKFIFPVADGRIKFSWRRSGTENIHPWYGNVHFEEKVSLIFLETQKGLFQHFPTHFRMPVKR